MAGDPTIRHHRCRMWSEFCAIVPKGLAGHDLNPLGRPGRQGNDTTAPKALGTCCEVGCINYGIK